MIPGFLHAATTEGGVVADPNFLDQLYRYGVFVAFGLAAVSYSLMAQAIARDATALRCRARLPVNRHPTGRLR